MGVSPACDFAALKRAYYQRAKECHPDRFPGRSEKGEEFRQLVEAFDILSDPARRKRFDEMREGTADSPPLYFGDDPESVMDTLADDTLEELIVGNTFPPNSSLRTLFLDLEQTERFLLYREARNRAYAGYSPHARELFGRLVKYSPNNILFHYYLACAHRKCGDFRQASNHHRICLQLGAGRSPPQRLTRIHRELRQCQDRLGGLHGRWGRLLNRPSDSPDATPAEQMRRKLSVDLGRVHRRRRKQRKRLRP